MVPKIRLPAPNSLFEILQQMDIISEHPSKMLYCRLSSWRGRRVKRQTFIDTEDGRFIRMYDRGPYQSIWVFTWYYIISVADKTV